jgi:hypothetical protein
MPRLKSGRERCHHAGIDEDDDLPIPGVMIASECGKARGYSGGTVSKAGDSECARVSSEAHTGCAMAVVVRAGGASAHPSTARG